MNDLFWSGASFFYITGATIIYPVREHALKSPWLWEVNRGNSHISLAIFPGYFGHQKFSLYPANVKIGSMEEYSEAKIYKNKPELRNETAIIFINKWKYSNQLPVAWSLFTTNH